MSFSSGSYFHSANPYSIHFHSQFDECRILNLPLSVRQEIEKALNVQERWMKLAEHPYVNLSTLDVDSMRKSLSPAGEVLDKMVNYGLTVNQLFDIFEVNNFGYLLDVIQKFAPHRYEEYRNRRYNPPIASQQSNDLRSTMVHEPPTMAQVLNPGGTNFPPSSGLRMNEPPPPPPTGPNQSNSDYSNLPSEVEGGNSPTSDYVNVVDVAARKYLYETISLATKGFAERYKIGEGYFGPVYKVEHVNMQLAAKLFNENFSMDAFMAELKLHIRHDNIVGLMGQSMDGPVRMLLYEYMENGTLRSNLDGNESLNMDSRLKVLSNAAAGLEWLHMNSPQILHRSLRSTKIMLDSRFVGKISGFHSVKNMPQSSITRKSYTHQHTNLTGTYQMKNKGYTAPDASGKLTDKTDVYAFGVIMFEALTGLQAYDEHQNRDQRALVDYLEYKIEKDDVEAFDLRDKRRKWRQETYRHLYKLAYDCTAENRKHRPSIALVCKRLNEISEDAEKDLAQYEENEVVPQTDEEPSSLQESTSNTALNKPPQKEVHQNPDYVNTENPDYANMAPLPPQHGALLRVAIAPAIANQFRFARPPVPTMQQFPTTPYPHRPVVYVQLHPHPHHPGFMHQLYSPMQKDYCNVMPSQDSLQGQRTPVEHDDPTSFAADQSDLQRLHSQISESESSLSLSSALNSIESPEQLDPPTPEALRPHNRPEPTPRLNSRYPQESNNQRGVTPQQRHDYENVVIPEPEDPIEVQADENDDQAEESEDEEPSSNLLEQIAGLNFD